MILRTVFLVVAIYFVTNFSGPERELNLYFISRIASFIFNSISLQKMNTYTIYYNGCRPWYKRIYIYITL